MRKLLLASVAALGASIGLADAATMVVTPEDMTGPGSAGPAPGSIAPGTVTVRLNGRVNFYAAAFSQYNANNPSGNTNGDANAKLGYYDMQTYARLIPSFDGVANNGLKYGAYMEMWSGNVQQTRTNVFSGATPYFRRIYGYLGTDQFGTIRVGAADGPMSLFLTGSSESFNDGGWDGDFPGMLSLAVDPTWPVYGDFASYYSTNKVVYLSPNFYGFDFGAAFEPNTSGSGGGDNYGAGCATPGQTPAAMLGCDALTSYPFGATPYASSRRNTVDVGGRYRGTFGAVGVAAFADYFGGGQVANNAFGYTNAYKNPSAGQGGVAVTIAGLTLSGWVGGGATNENTGLAPKGEPDSIAYILGAQYVTGPLTVGVQFFDAWNAGAALPGNGIGHINEWGVATGGTYALAPGVSLYFTYMYGGRKENGFDLINNVPNSPLNNHTNVQLVGVGTQFNW